MSTTEAQLRAQLGIPSSAKQVIILASTSHLDWDWLATFEGYYSSNQFFPINGFQNYAVRDIFNDAATYLNENTKNGGQTCTQSNPTQLPPYYYSIAEVGYLQAFAADPLGHFAQLQAVGDLLRIVGGGITSPDNLLPHGETLLRNFVIANAWLLTNFPAAPSSGLPAIPALRQVWIPDDFGHDAQFPILMEAMGLQGVGFSRIPGDPQQYDTLNSTPNSGIIPGGPTMAAWLLVFGDAFGEHLGTDFIWQASDGSTTLAHFMQAAYYQGSGISSPGDIQTYYDTNKGAAPTPYIFVPVGVDFSLPVQNLVQYACGWNATYFASTGVYAVAATFDHYIQLVSFHQQTLLTRSSNPDLSMTFPFVPAPYWTGVYGSRPEIKIQHQQATRALLGAELYSVIANFLSVSGVASAQASIATGWVKLTPSTHHDYITGTAANSVYSDEQLPLLANAITLGNSALSTLQQNLAAQIKVSAVTDQIAVTVFNQLGFARGGLVEMEPVSDFTPVAFGNAASGLLGPVQISSDGKWLFCIPTNAGSIVPALGYNTYFLTSDTSVKVPTYTSPASAVKSADGTNVAMSNAFFSAEINAADGWGLASFNEIVEGSTSAVLQGPANQAIYFDESANSSAGDMYKFANELGGTFDTEPAQFSLTSVEVVENGPVRARVIVNGNYTVNGNPQFTREYLIVVDEPFLRMKATSAAPNPYSVFVMFPFSTGDIDTIFHGTPYHWDTKPSQPVVNTYKGWVPPIFSATHDFVMPSSAGTILGAIYHAHLPAWAITGDNKSLIGCLLRNPTNDKDPQKAPGDADSHTLEYALRVPSGLSQPKSATPQKESLAYSTPLQACVAGGSAAGSLAANFSMASLSVSNAYVTAVKTGTVTGPALGQIIIRVYQPTLQAQQLTLTLPPAPAGQHWQATGITALETALSAAKTTTLNVAVNGNQISFLAERAITTLAVSLIQNQ